MSDNYSPDPRPDLKQDHPLWTSLLINAHSIDPDIEGLLHGLRCLGARLLESPDRRLKLTPGQITAAEWEEIKVKWLTPNREKITEAIRTTEIGTVTDEVAEGEIKTATGSTGQLTFGMTTGARR